MRSCAQETRGDELWTGSLHCDRCQGRYPLVDGIAVLLPAPQAVSSPPSHYETPAWLAAYLWSHYADILKDPDAGSAYRGWAGLLEPGEGLALDAGCAVGRFTFEMGRRAGFAVGIDNSLSFVRTARDLLHRRCLSLRLPEEGTLVEEKTLNLPEAWASERVEFVVGDVQALPFASGSFSALASLNILDKVPLPLAHLREMNRAARERPAQMLLSDPFSWSAEVAREEEWLGGTARGPWAGRSLDHLQTLLAGRTGEILPPWGIRKQGHVWWKIRHHRNHFELIRSCYLKASRP